MKYNTKYRPSCIVQEYRSNYQTQHVALIGGGMSAEREVSLLSSQAVLEALSSYHTTFIDMGADIAQVLTQLKPDVVFNCLHGTFGEDGCLPALLNLMNIAYTHSGMITSVLSFNKKLTRNQLLNAGIKCAHGIIIDKAQHYSADPLPRPYVIKPLSQGSSIGVQVIFSEDNFDFSKYSFPYGDQILVEQYITGKELQVAVLNGKALGVLEIELLKNRFYDYQTKYTEGFANHIFPARISEAAYNYVMQLSERIYQLFECRGIVRVEFIYDHKQNEFYCLELNTHPGMTALSICPELAKHQGISFNQLIVDLLQVARCD